MVQRTPLRAPEDDVIYRGPIRSGQYGRVTEDDFTVRLHIESDSAYLDPMPSATDAFYSSGEYREAYNETGSIESYRHAHDGLQSQMIARTDLGALRGIVVGDIGCGGGSFLDLVQGYAAETIGVEPASDFHEALAGQGHQPFSSLGQLSSTRGQVLDHAFSFHVIEHVADPIEFVGGMAACTRPGGLVTLVTPNRHDVVGKLGIPEFDPFRYRTAHLWYLSETSMSTIAEATGLELVRVEYQHRYDAANLFRWLRDRRPTGRGGMDGIFDPVFDGFLTKWLEGTGLADSLWAEFRIPDSASAAGP